jgi:hypothetical protein
MKLVFGGCPNQLLPELGVTVFLGFKACKFGSSADNFSLLDIM